MDNLPSTDQVIEKRFNLISEKWIRVTSGTGVEEVSLNELLVNAHKYSQISGEMTLQDFAIFRLVSAILRSAILDRNDSLTEEVWTEMWINGHFDEDMITSYLYDEYIYDRFYLIHPVHPFYQSQEMSPMTDVGIKPSRNLVLDAPSEDREFMTFRSSKAYDDGLTLPEAARWLLGSMGYDPCGAHSASLGDPRVDSSGGGKGRSYPKKTSLSLISGIQIIGDNLFETLLLNTIPMEIEERLNDDLPIWEIGSSLPPGPFYEVGGDRTKPMGILQLLTWPSRRIKLYSEGDKVTECMISAGDAFDPTDTHMLEPMASYKEGKEEGTLVPYVQNSEHMFWRGYDSILSSSSRYSQPLNIQFLGNMRARGVVPNKMYRLALNTAKHDSPMSSLLTDSLYEVNPLPASVINNVELENNVISALEKIEQTRKMYWSYGMNCSLSTINDKEVAKKLAGSFSDLFLSECEDIFYKWLTEMSEGKYDAPTKEIIDQLEELLHGLATENEKKTHNPKAFLGTEGDNGKIMSLSIARNMMIGKFRKAMRKSKESA